jgi:hypothetical protein
VTDSLPKEEVRFYGAFGEMREGYNDEWVRTRDYLDLQKVCDDLQEQLNLREHSDSHDRCDAEIQRLRAALIWIYEMRCLHKEPPGCGCPVCVAKVTLGIEDV